MTEPSYRDHSPDCLKELMIRVDHTNNVVKPFIGMSGRWDCPACRISKFAGKIEHLVSLDKVVLSVERSPGGIRAFADDMRQGCLIIYLRSKWAVVVTTPEVMPDAEPTPTLDALQQCMSFMDREGVSRVVLNDYWKAPEVEPVEQSVRYAHCDTMDEVDEVLQEIGLTRRYTSYYLNGIPSQEVVERLDEVLYQRQGVDPDLFSDP